MRDYHTGRKSVWFWCRPSKKALFLLPVFFLFLVSITVLSLDCLSHQDQSYLCPIFFSKPSMGFESIDYGIEVATNTEVEPTLLDTDSLKLPDVDSIILQNEEKIDVSDLQKIINTENNKQKIWNLDKFGAITSDTIIIVIQAHRRLEYLQALIKCLKESKYIESTLLVFSHGFYSEDINNVVQSIQFTRVLQIFFPYGLQTHPNTFPGFSPNDCPYGISEEEIDRIKCLGRPRDVKSLQVKHHWWWKVNMVFNGLRITRNFNGLVFLLEEDHYVFPDFLHVLRLMREIVPEKCPDCNIYGLGHNPRHTTVNDYKGLADKVKVDQWNNMGFAFDRQFWTGLNSQRCSNMFCEYNDYNWDFTLSYLSHKCLPQPLKPLNVVSSRVFHIGDCGVHFHGQNCSSQRSLKIVNNLQQDVSQFLFPPVLTVSSTRYRQIPIDGRNGWWNDPRDIQLCKNISQELHW